MKGRTIALALLAPFPAGCSAEAVVDEWLANCYVWPAVGGAPPEHRDWACDKVKQNAELNARQLHAESLPKSQLTPDTVYLALPEEKTYDCPEESTQITPSEHASRGHATRWILSNEASSPIILTYINPLGLETSAHDRSVFPAHSNTAVYPNGPIVMPGQMAVVNGLMGQVFLAREYKEMAPPDAMNSEDTASWESFKSELPTTLSFLPTESRYMNRNRVLHVLGQPGRVLMRHQMGNIFIRNNYGGVCPEMFGGGGDEAAGDDRQGTPRDTNPDCNVLKKAFLNKVGCPIDLYFSPEKKNPEFECEVFARHLGPLDSYLKKGPSRDIDGKDSPLFFTNTYNGHTFTARMSHDQSLVARIELNHDKVTDCPEPKKFAAGVYLPTMEILATNSTTASLHSDNRWSVVGSQNVSLPALARKARSHQAKAQPEWIHDGSNRTVLVLAS